MSWERDLYEDYYNLYEDDYKILVDACVLNDLRTVKRILDKPDLSGMAFANMEWIADYAEAGGPEGCPNDEGVSIVVGPEGL